jgi:DNA-binding transcriptional regulator YiaG
MSDSTETTYHNPCGERPIIDPDLGHQFQYGYRNLIRAYHQTIGAAASYDGATIARDRTRAGLTRRQLAAAIGCPPDAIARWEQGKRLPSLPRRALAWRLLRGTRDAAERVQEVA